MPFQFVKMHGLGNDFIITRDQHGLMSRADFVKQLSHRKTGIGFDQWLDATALGDQHFQLHIVNADGSLANQCGNGLRCMGEHLMQADNHLYLSLKQYSHSVARLASGDIEVDMGMAKDLSNQSHLLQQQTLNFPDIHFQVYLVDVGNPHAIIFTEQTPIAPLFDDYAALIATHASLGEGINVSFAHLPTANHCVVRVFERGVGETLACGSAGVALSAAIWQHQQHQEPLQIEFRGGTLHTRRNQQGSIFQRGPVKTVFQGQLNAL